MSDSARLSAEHIRSVTSPHSPASLVQTKGFGLREVKRLLQAAKRIQMVPRWVLLEYWATEKTDRVNTMAT